MDTIDSGKPSLLIAGKTPLTWISEICVKANAKLNFEVENDPQLSAFRVTCKVSAIAGKDFIAVESARNIKSAKHLAAVAILTQFGLSSTDLAGISKKNFADVLAIIKQNNQTVSLEAQESAPVVAAIESTSEEECLPKLQPAPPAPETQLLPESVVPVAAEEFEKLGKKNFTLQLNEFCAKSKIALPVYKVLNIEGPSHRPAQTLSCTVQGGNDEPYYLEGTYIGSLKVIRQLLASQMLAKIQEDAVRLKAYQEIELKRQAEEEKRLLDAFNLKTLEKQEAAMCKDEKCAKLADHSHHFLQKNLRGQSLALLKSAIEKKELTKKNSVNILNMICDEHIARGFDVKTEYEYYVKAEITICFVHFHFNKKDSSHSKPYTQCGSGGSKDRARGIAAKEMLEFLIEMSYHKGV